MAEGVAHKAQRDKGIRVGMIFASTECCWSQRQRPGLQALLYTSLEHSPARNRDDATLDFALELFLGFCFFGIFTTAKLFGVTSYLRDCA